MFDGIDPDRLDAEVFGEDGVLFEVGDKWAVVFDAPELVRPEIGGQCRELEAMIDDHFAQLLPLFLGVVANGVRMRVDAEQLDAR